MLISKFDLYKTEWLDLVFDDRNKAYGAYSLRRNYAGTMVKAMGITFFGVAVLCGASIILKTEKPLIHVTHVTQDLILPAVVPPVKHVEPPATHQHFKAQSITTTQHVPPIVVVDYQAKKPVINDQITGAIGQTTLKGKEGANVEIPEISNNGTASTPLDDKTIHSTSDLDAMPMPVGGESAWAKFLHNTLRYPAAAQEDGLTGKVWLSFVIEKDGHLSNIVVERGAGHGFDEEALRVLRLAKAWKPGMQNGQPVRVKYTIPIAFQLAE
ncbi:MAG: energy transducer TonB [Mucilaginibacter sp.]